MAAIYRQIQSIFWSDSFIETITMQQKCFFLFLLTNDKTRHCGIYEISKRQMSFSLNISESEVQKLLDFFISKGKIKYSDTTNEIAIKNWAKHNLPKVSETMRICVSNELKEVKDKALVDYLFSPDYIEDLPTVTPEIKEPKKRKISECFIAPAQSEVEQFFIEKGYSKEQGAKAFSYYDVAKWKDVHGNQVKNWKQKMLSVWMKDPPPQKTKPLNIQSDEEIERSRQRLQQLKSRSGDDGQNTPTG